MNALRRSKSVHSFSSPFAATNSSPRFSSWINLKSFFNKSPTPPKRNTISSPRSITKRGALSRKRWKSMFSSDGRIRDGGVKLLKKVRKAGIDPSIRKEVWPFLLGVYDLNSSKADRNIIKIQKRNEYMDLRRRCQQLSSQNNRGNLSLISTEFFDTDSNFLEDMSESNERQDYDYNCPIYDKSPESKSGYLNKDEEDGEDEEDFISPITDIDPPSIDIESSNFKQKLSTTSEDDMDASYHRIEDFSTWQRIIRVDALRANTEWIIYAPSQAVVSEETAYQFASLIGLKDFNNLDPFMIYHASRLVAILEAYAIYDPEVGYCQGMSDLLSPILAIIEDDSEAFWCFVGFMNKARQNFRMDEMGIRRQLKIVSKIVKLKDPCLYRHLEKLQAEECFFVYRMVVVLLSRELCFDQTVSLWEVMWANSASVRAKFGKSASEKIRLRAPPTDDLLLYAIAACVLHMRKVIIKSCSSMDDVIRLCNSLPGNLDVWKLLDDAHDLVVALHDKIK